MSENISLHVVAALVVIVVGLMLFKSCDTYKIQLQQDKELHLACMQHGGTAIDNQNGWFKQCIGAHGDK